MKVLVTGGAGFIGSHVVEKLIRDSHFVVIVDNMSSGKMENIAHLLGERAILAACDIRHAYDLAAIFLRYEPQMVLHLAAQPSIVASQASPQTDLQINGVGTLNVIHAAERAHVRRIVFASTSAVYPPDSRVCMEVMTLYPESPYGISKMAAENYLRLFGRATILRLGNVYGPRQVPLGENQVIPRMIRHRLYGDPFTIHGDGNQSRDFVYVEDVADAFSRAMDEDGLHAYNIASGQQISINTVADLVSELSGDSSLYDWPHDDQRDPRRAVNMAVELANFRLKWSVKTPLLIGLTQTVGWWKKQKGEKNATS